MYAFFLALREPHVVTIDPLPPSTSPTRDAVPNHHRNSSSSAQFESPISSVSTNAPPSGRSHTTSPLVPATRQRSELEGENRIDAFPHLTEIRPCALPVPCRRNRFDIVDSHQIQRTNERASDKGLKLLAPTQKLLLPVGWEFPLLSTISLQKTRFRCVSPSVNMNPTLRHPTSILDQVLHHYHPHQRPMGTLRMAARALSMDLLSARKVESRRWSCRVQQSMTIPTLTGRSIFGSSFRVYETSVTCAYLTLFVSSDFVRA